MESVGALICITCFYENSVLSGVQEAQEEGNVIKLPPKEELEDLLKVGRILICHGIFEHGWALGQVFRFHREIPMDGFLKFPAVYFCLFHRISYLCQKYTSIICS